MTSWLARLFRGAEGKSETDSERPTTAQLAPEPEILHGDDARALTREHCPEACAAWAQKADALLRHHSGTIRSAAQEGWGGISFEAFGPFGDNAKANAVLIDVGAQHGYQVSIKRAKYGPARIHIEWVSPS